MSLLHGFRTRFTGRPRLRRTPSFAPSVALEGRVLLAGVTGEAPAGGPQTPPVDPFVDDLNVDVPDGPPVDYGEGREPSVGGRGDAPPATVDPGIGGPEGGAAPGTGVGTPTPGGSPHGVPDGLEGAPELLDDVARILDFYLEQAARDREAAERLFDELGDAVAEAGFESGDPILAQGGAAIDSLLDDLGLFVGGLVDPAGTFREQVEGLVDTFESAGGGSDGTQAVAREVFGADGMAAGYSGYAADGTALDPLDRVGAFAGGLAQASGAFLAILTPFGAIRGFDGGGGSGGKTGGGGGFARRHRREYPRHDRHVRRRRHVGPRRQRHDHHLRRDEPRPAGRAVRPGRSVRGQ